MLPLWYRLSALKPHKCKPFTQIIFYPFLFGPMTPVSQLYIPFSPSVGLPPSPSSLALGTKARAFCLANSLLSERSSACTSHSGGGRTADLTATLLYLHRTKTAPAERPGLSHCTHTQTERQKESWSLRAYWSARSPSCPLTSAGIGTKMIAFVFKAQKLLLPITAL